jgi:hypothetical protein
MMGGPIQDVAQQATPPETWPALVHSLLTDLFAYWWGPFVLFGLIGLYIWRKYRPNITISRGDKK